MKSKACIHCTSREKKGAKRDFVFSNSWRTQYCLCNTLGLQRFFPKHRKAEEAEALAWC